MSYQTLTDQATITVSIEQYTAPEGATHFCPENDSYFATWVRPDDDDPERWKVWCSDLRYWAPTHRKKAEMPGLLRVDNPETFARQIDETVRVIRITKATVGYEEAEKMACALYRLGLRLNEQKGN